MTSPALTDDAGLEQLQDAQRAADRRRDEHRGLRRAQLADGVHAELERPAASRASSARAGRRWLRRRPPRGRASCAGRRTSRRQPPRAGWPRRSVVVASFLALLSVGGRSHERDVVAGLERRLDRDLLAAATHDLDGHFVETRCPRGDRRSGGPRTGKIAPGGTSSMSGILPTAMRATALMPGRSRASASLIVSFRSKFFAGGQPGREIDAREHRDVGDRRLDTRGPARRRRAPWPSVRL